MEVNSKSILRMIAKECGLKRNTIEERLKLQKAVFLLQICGVKLGYGFNWYKYGPYSQELADDAYTVLYEKESEYAQTESWSFSKNSKALIDKFNRWFDCFKDDIKMVELVASVAFMKLIWDKDTNKLDTFIKDFKEKKSKLLKGEDFTNDEVQEAIAFVEKCPQS